MSVISDGEKWGNIWRRVVDIGLALLLCSCALNARIGMLTHCLET